MLSLNSVPKVHPETGLQQVKGRWLAATPDNALHSFEDGAGVSEVAERIVSLIDGKKTVKDVAAVLATEFEVGAAECEAETLKFVGLLIEKKILAL